MKLSFSIYCRGKSCVRTYIGVKMINQASSESSLNEIDMNSSGDSEESEE